MTTTTPLVYRPSDFRREFIQDDVRLREVSAQLQQYAVLGVDVEMVQRVQRLPAGQQQWTQVLALIQIAGSDVSVVVDPVRCSDLSPLRLVMASSARKVFLGGGQDVALLEGAGIPARNIVDVGEASLALFGRREDGMAALARRIFDVTLDKTVRTTNWLARPLNPALLSYAHRDAELTLLIFGWFRDHYPELLALHERYELEPGPPASIAPWLQEAMRRPTADAAIVVGEHGLELERDTEVISDDVEAALATDLSPRQVNRVVRTAADLGLVRLLSDIEPLLQSPSATLRAGAARAIGKLAGPEDGRSLLERLKEDPIEDVRMAAEGALREMSRPRINVAEVVEEDQLQPSLGEDALSALKSLMDELKEDPGAARSDA